MAKWAITRFWSSPESLWKTTEQNTAIVFVFFFALLITAKIALKYYISSVRYFFSSWALLFILKWSVGVKPRRAKEWVRWKVKKMHSVPYLVKKYRYYSSYAPRLRLTHHCGSWIFALCSYEFMVSCFFFFKY